jgi:hypothetical protein
MSDSKAIRAAAAAPAARREGQLESWKDFGTRSWPERAAKAPAPAAGAHRHSAITRGLSSYANYKTWADKVRTSWEAEDDKDGKDG